MPRWEYLTIEMAELTDINVYPADSFQPPEWLTRNYQLVPGNKRYWGGSTYGRAEWYITPRTLRKPLRSSTVSFKT